MNGLRTAAHSIRSAARVVSLGVAVGVFGLATTAAAQSGETNPGAGAAKMKCADLVRLKIPGSTAIITKATAVPAAEPNTVQYMPPAPMKVGVAIPSYCRAEGEIDKRIGAGGKHYAIGFAIALPDRWGGRFLYQGGGGLNGTIAPPLGMVASGGRPALARGFAVVSTDSGHKGAVFDASFFADQEATLNFASSSVGKVTSTAKAIIAAYYGAPVRRSYFTGCSTGGREGMLASERYPEDFDGIVSGDPAMNTGMSNLGLAWFNHQMTQIAPKDASGTPQPEKAFSATDRKLVVDGILKACDAADGVKDGMIFNPKQCHFDPAMLQCTGVKTDTCLLPQQVAALKKAFAGPKNSRGTQVYPAFPWDTGIDAHGFIPGILTSGGGSPVNATAYPTLDVDAIEDNVDGNGVTQLTNTVRWSNLTSYFAHGGKILYFHGWSDPWFSPLDTLEYYERMAKGSGGLDKVRAQSSRIFFVPGMGHCGGGPATLDNFDLLAAVVNWVENGKAPDSVIATGHDYPGRSRPLCAWPLHAQYKGSGDPEDAVNFTCED
jgi:Tannase and feruloyl esterase